MSLRWRRSYWTTSAVLANALAHVLVGRHDHDAFDLRVRLPSARQPCPAPSSASHSTSRPDDHAQRAQRVLGQGELVEQLRGTP